MDPTTLISDPLEHRLTEAQPRAIKVGRTYQGGSSANLGVRLLAWQALLTEASFSEGNVVQVTIAPGEIRLTRQSSSFSPE